ncbi:hypothetical protein HPB50_015816 [Hyalomma asiaticum]|uniref:Uncharacterized protein n=1 Tax=Hyalomma asiaticum TaxID=266040 RepID=A0ACB7RWK0_HYAAI|nr:hypothetical protein HPB50_015816 [Hyalomma asiaticum]
MNHNAGPTVQKGGSLSSTPESVGMSVPLEAKYVYIAGNPYDTCVSFYYRTKDIPFYQFRGKSFGEFLELFLQGRVEYGDYLENVVAWYKHANDSSILFLTYEELKKDTPLSVHKIAAFMGP